MKRLIALAATAVLTACGGGGSDAVVTPVPAAASAEGFWNGTITGGYGASVAILENGETWGIYTSGNSLVGAVHAQTTSNNLVLTGSGSSFNFLSRQSGSGTYSGSFVPKNSINFTTNDGTKFTGSYGTTYEQPASLADLAGTYSGFSVTATTGAQSIPVTISAGGTISGSVVSGNLSCSASGTATPRASGKNIFNVQLSFSGNFCALGNGATTAGVAYYDAVNREIGVMTLNSAKTDGLVYIGKR